MRTNASMERLAKSLLLTVLARVVNIVGVPLGVGFLFWLSSTVYRVELVVETLPAKLADVQRQLDAHGRRLDRLEAPLFSRGGEK